MRLFGRKKNHQEGEMGYGKRQRGGKMKTKYSKYMHIYIGMCVFFICIYESDTINTLTFYAK